MNKCFHIFQFVIFFVFVKVIFLFFFLIKLTFAIKICKYENNIQIVKYFEELMILATTMHDHTRTSNIH